MAVVHKYGFAVASGGLNSNLVSWVFEIYFGIRMAEALFP
jgi:hypothetical protein